MYARLATAQFEVQRVLGAAAGAQRRQGHGWPVETASYMSDAQVAVSAALSELAEGSPSAAARHFDGDLSPCAAPYLSIYQPVTWDTFAHRDRDRVSRLLG